MQVSRVSLGVGGVALYGGGGNSCVWYNSLSSAHTSTPHSLVSPEGSKCVDVQWDCLQLPEGETATSVSIGQTHLVALTNSHNGLLCLFKLYAPVNTSFLALTLIDPIIKFKVGCPSHSRLISLLHYLKTLYL